MKAFVLSLCVFISMSGPACPLCDSKTAKEIRSSLFGTDFLPNLLVALLPFGILAAAAYAIYRGGFSSHRPNKAAKHDKA